MISIRVSAFSRASLRRTIASVVLGVFLLPIGAMAAPEQYLNGADNVPVSRGDFLKAVVSALNLSLPKPDTKLPYKRVSSGDLPIVTLAHQKGALVLFGENLQLGKGITRLEAAVILAKITGKTIDPTTSVPALSDVKGKLQEEAVAIVVQQGWMRHNGRIFGSAKVLKTREAKLIMDKIAQDAGQKIRVRVQDIRKSQDSVKTDTMNQVWQLLSDEYLYKDRLDGSKAGTKAIQSMVETLNDPYTVYMPPAASERFNDQIKGEIEGIGATVELVNGAVVIVSPIHGSPAEKAGLQPKDEIISVDGKTLAGLSIDDAVGHIRGPKGSTAKLKIRRNGVEMEISVTRATVQLPEVEITQQGDITIIRIVQFGQATDTKLDTYMKSIESAHPRGIVLDLRDNPGGLLHAAGVVVGHFLPKGSVYANISGRSGSYDEKTSEEPTIDASVKLVVLVNHGSASASEIVAGALQDAKRGTIVGQKTYGKGTVQQVVTFSDNSSLKFTVAEWRTPLGRKIDGQGVDPDVLVDASAGRDAEMLKAIDILR